MIFIKEFFSFLWDQAIAQNNKKLEAEIEEMVAS